MLARAIAAWLVIMVAETVHGALRAVLIEPFAGDLRAGQIGVVTGAALIFGLAYLLRPWLPARATNPLLLIGLLWVALTLAFEFALGRLVFGLSWERLAGDYDLSRGGLMPFGLLAMALTPLAAARLRDARSGRTA